MKPWAVDHPRRMIVENYCLDSNDVPSIMLDGFNYRMSLPCVCGLVALRGIVARDPPRRVAKQQSYVDNDDKHLCVNRRFWAERKLS
jgi:hypothetical protein